MVYSNSGLDKHETKVGLPRMTQQVSLFKITWSHPRFKPVTCAITHSWLKGVLAIQSLVVQMLTISTIRSQGFRGLHEKQWGDSGTRTLVQDLPVFRAQLDLRPSDPVPISLSAGLELQVCGPTRQLLLLWRSFPTSSRNRSQSAL